MNQEITISHNTILFLADNLPAFEINDALFIIKRLKENYFVIDAKYEFAKLLWEETKKVQSKEVREYLQRFLSMLFNDKKSLVDCNFEKEEVLAQKSSDKIFFDPLSVPKTIRKIEKEFGIEVHNSSSFVSPKLFHKLKHGESKLVFEKDIIYDLKRIFEPYLRKTNFIKIEDPFLSNPKALNNFKILMEIFNGNVVYIKTHSERNFIHYYHKNEEKGKLNYNNLKEYLNRLKSKAIKIELDYYNERKHFERYIYTEKLKIKLPGGLDFLNEEGMTNNENVEIEVSPRENSA